MRQMRLISAWIPVLAGLGILVFVAGVSLGGALVVALPAAFMITGGGRMLLSPDLRGPQHVAVGTVLGALLALPIGFISHPEAGLATLLASLAAILAGGWYQIRLQPVIDEIPSPAPSLLYSARVALDNLTLSAFSLMTPLPSAAALRTAVQESEAAEALFSRRDWLQQPQTYHSSPPPLDNPQLAPLRIGGVDCEELSFASGYDPEQGFPGRERWLAYRENQTARVLLLRQPRPAPWLICVHGFGMGDFKQLLKVFHADQLHRRTGVNIALFVLPVHGKRAPGKVSGEKYFGLSPMDFIHAETQAIWDLRRLVGWVRQQGASQVGLYGISLGGYTSSVLSALEQDLAFVIAGIPPSDVLHTGQFLASSIERRIPAAAGVDLKRDRSLLRVVSPLSMSPLIEEGRRYIYAATGDQFVPIEQVRALWLHWSRPRITWYTSGHMSLLMQRQPRVLVEEVIADAFTTGDSGGE